MVKAFVLLGALLLTVLTSPVIAQKDKNKAQDNLGQLKKEARISSQNSNPTSSPSTEECDPSLEWKNHGEYVSCVARQHLGGKVTSEAAKSDIGKKNQVSTPSASPTSSPISTPNPSTSPSGSPSASVSPTASASATPEATSSGILGLGSGIRDLINILKQFLKSLRFLF